MFMRFPKPWAPFLCYSVLGSEGFVIKLCRGGLRVGWELGKGEQVSTVGWGGGLEWWWGGLFKDSW